LPVFKIPFWNLKAGPALERISLYASVAQRSLLPKNRGSMTAHMVGDGTMKQTLIQINRIQQSIYLIRAQKVMLDRDLAGLYGIPTKVLKQAVRRNIERFPEDFMIELSQGELDILRSQIVTSSSWGGLRYPPMAFTE
jgi:hypothetical protein